MAARNRGRWLAWCLWLAELLRILNPLALILMLASLAIGVLAPIVRFRRSGDVERQQIKWFAYATALLVAAIVIPAALYYPDFNRDNVLLSGTLMAIAGPLVPAAVGIAILRHGLYDIDLIINRTLVYAALTACVVGLYVLVVGYLGTLFRSSDNLLISLIATGVVAALFQPLRERLQRAVNRLLYGERDEPYAVLARLVRQLETAVALESIVPTIVETLARSLRLPYVAIAAQREDGPAIIAAYGAPIDAPLVLPLLFQNEPVGQLLLAPRARRAARPSRPAAAGGCSVAGRCGAACGRGDRGAAPIAAAIGHGARRRAPAHAPRSARWAGADAGRAAAADRCRAHADAARSDRGRSGAG